MSLFGSSGCDIMRMLGFCVITFCERGPATSVTPMTYIQSPSTQSWATSHDNHTGQTFVREVVIYLICMLVVVCWAMNRIRMLPHHLEDKVAIKGHSCVVCLFRCVCGVVCVCVVCVCVCVCKNEIDFHSVLSVIYFLLLTAVTL